MTPKRKAYTKLETGSMLGELVKGLPNNEEGLGAFMRRLSMHPDTDTIRTLLIEEGAKSLLERRAIKEAFGRSGRA